MALIVSVSGVRGIVGSELTPEVVLRYAAALGTVLGGGPIALGRDSRPSGNAFRHAAIAGLTGVGCEVRDLGIVPTPTCGFLVRELGCRGGLMITASHNPAPYNGLKLFGPDGAVHSATAGAEIQKQFASATQGYVEWNACGKLINEVSSSQRHWQRVLELVDISAIRARKFSVVLDGNGGAGGPSGLAMLQALGCAVVAVNCEADGIFRHEPEPTPAQLQDVAGIVKATQGAIGFALDPDSDRLALIDETGVCLSEELTLALAVRERLSHDRGPVVINLSSSRVTEDIASAAGVKCLRSAVGEANVVAKMREVGALIGGEGNGGVIDPRVGWVRDPFVGMALILQHMVRTGQLLNQLAIALPQYVIRKEKISMARERLPELFEKISQHWSNAEIDRTDGIRVAWPDRWVHLRASNTEPIVRVIAEAPRAAEAEALCEELKAVAE
ncbi:MAG: phosphoglucosamine mutase [Gemmataceae bacterium]